MTGTEHRLLMKRARLQRRINQSARAASEKDRDLSEILHLAGELVGWFAAIIAVLFVIAAVLSVTGCAAAGDDFSVSRDSGRWVIDYDLPDADEASDGLLQAPLVSQTGPMFISTDRVMYVAPDATVAQYLPDAISRLTALGFNIVIDPTGIPMYVDDTVPAGSQARTYFKRFCFYDSCTAANTYVKVTHSLLALPPGFIRNSLIHELGHILSGFGGCAAGKHLPMASDGSHLVTGNIISNGNSGYGSFNLTQDDFQLMRSCL